MGWQVLELCEEAVDQFLPGLLYDLSALGVTVVATGVKALDRVTRAASRTKRLHDKEVLRQIDDGSWGLAGAVGVSQAEQKRGFYSVAHCLRLIVCEISVPKAREGEQQLKARPLLVAAVAHLQKNGTRARRRLGRWSVKKQPSRQGQEECA